MLMELQKPRGIKPANNGFALIATISVMVLLVMIALAMLSLSTIETRQTTNGGAIEQAQANARMALMLAIGELQKQVGPDQRVTITADQLAESADGKKSAAYETSAHWTGVYKSWSPTETSRPTPEFLSWLVSAPPSDTGMVDFAKASTTPHSVTMVNTGTLGPSGVGKVEVPTIAYSHAGKSSGRYGWWVGDQGVKAAIGTQPAAPPVDLASTRNSLQSVPRPQFELSTNPSQDKPFATVAQDTSAISKITSWKQAELVASNTEAARPLFHDLAGHTAGLLTNVRAGGFRKDLSILLEQPLSAAMKSTRLYSVGGKAGINQGELWLYYNLWRELKTGGDYTFTTGGTLDLSTPYLQVESTKAGMEGDPTSIYKHPAFISMKTIFSLYGKTVGSGPTAKIRPYLVIDPVVTYWNPFDVPLVITPAYHSVKYWKPPYDLHIKRANGTIDVYNTNYTVGAGNDQYITLRIGLTMPIVLKPGEVFMASQAAGGPMLEYDRGGRKVLETGAGWNFGSGVAYALNSGAPNAKDLAPDETIRYEFAPNDTNSKYFLTANPAYFLNTYFDEGGANEYSAIGTGVFVNLQIAANDPTYSRVFANQLTFQDSRPLTSTQLLGRKEPVLIMAFSVKTEEDSDRPGRYFARFNPQTGIDFQTLLDDEFETFPWEIHISLLNSWKNRDLEVSPNGQAFFGGGHTAQSGSSLITTHSIPREPLISLAAFQNSLANGFAWSGSRLSQGNYLLPQIGHAIGNSAAPSIMPSGVTESTLGGSRPLADHSYLANKALWDDWFLSGIAPQTAPSYYSQRSQRQVAGDFIEGKKPTGNSHYIFAPTVGGETPQELLSRWFDGDKPREIAITETAAHISVAGMFNINSTSVQAWKTLLAGLNKQQIATRDGGGKESMTATEGIPIAALRTPNNEVAEKAGLGRVMSTPQWTGYRVLTEGEIELLAERIVVEVRKRGPFLCLADFVNRRPGYDKELARAGAIQNALDSSEVTINDSYNTGLRAASTDGPDRGFAFPEAEAGPAAYGIPGVVKQGDILTPLAPYLSARSDTFVIRAYGETLDESGKVIAQAWCEAEVIREARFVDPGNEPTADISALNPANRLFGRHYKITSFRWLNPSEV
ncbi:MAG: hypothetical protein H7A51_14535 [Akkermansiaceae bacterium]|nr:hypothetical protein [Akkermansiaceae bacterium]